MGMGDRQLAEAIQADGIDILIDLSGHSGHNRLAMFAWKPAPIQATWLGYGATTGVEAIDYVLSDRWVLPPEDEGHFSEAPWRMPNCWVCFTPPDLDLAVGPPPAQANGFTTFGSFNNLAKMSDAAVDCWAKVLTAVPESRLLLKSRPLGDEAGRRRTLARFSECGIVPERLIVKGRSPDTADHLATYNLVDIGLDPFPYSGGTTTVEAMWMGVPVLGLKGDRFVSRIGESILNNAGLGDWIADLRRISGSGGISFGKSIRPPGWPKKSAALRELSREFTEGKVQGA